MKKIISVVFLLIAIVGGYFAFKFLNKYKLGNVEKEGYILVPTGANFEQVLDSISPFLKNKESFREVALQKKLDQKIKSGRYKIESGADNSQLVNMIKAGNQTPNSFRIGDFGTVYQMIGRVSRKTEADSLTFVNSFNKIAQEKGLNNAEDLKNYFFSDTYEFYWTVKPEDFFKKFEKDYQEFWTAEREAKLKNLGITKNQVYALASIVYKESGGKTDEQKTIAGLYLNRFRKGMKLQSDPTVIYAINKEDNFKSDIKRVLYKHLSVQSPYNTYKNAGIPPGPICIVDKSSVDAVLNAENHHYIFMCADPKRMGYHKFTDNDAEHAKNAKEYQDWLNSRQIK